MASISSAGKFDSVDLNTKVSAASALTRPINGGKLSSTASDVDARISSTARIQSLKAAATDAAKLLMQPETWRATLASSSNEAAVSAHSNSSASRGVHSVVVDSIAMAQVTSSAIFSSVATVIGLGTMNIEMGSWNTSQTAFATNPNWPKASVVFGPRDNSLDRIKDKINAAGIGVIATVMSDATGSRLVLRSTSTGAANGFKVSTSPEPGLPSSDAPTAVPLSMLQFDPSSVATGAGMTLIQAAQNAKLTLDGQRIESESNTIGDAAQGLSLSLRDQTDQPVTVRVDQDTGTILRTITDFAQAYNDLQQQLDLPASDREGNVKKIAAAMRGNSDLRSSQTSGDGPRLPASLAEAGLRMNESGRLQVDEVRLAAALNQHPEALRARLTEAQTGTPDNAVQPPLQQLSARLWSPQPQQIEAAQQGPSRTDGSDPEPAITQRRQKLLEQYQPNGADSQLSPLHGPA